MPLAQDVGAHALQVWARNHGSTAAYESYLATTFEVIGPALPSLRLSGPEQSPAGVGTVWFASVSGEAQPLEYKYLRLDADGWHVARDFSGQSSYQWTLGIGDVGDHAMQVWVRRIGSTAPYEWWAGKSVVITDHAVLTVTSAVAPNAVPGAPITFTTYPKDSTFVEYQFFRVDADGWHIVQEYSHSNTYTWTPSPGDAGSHAVQVWVRTSREALDNWGSVEFVVY